MLTRLDDDYALENYLVDMTVRLHKHGQEIARVTHKEMSEAKLFGDTVEMTFARALAIRRLGMGAIDHQPVPA